MRKLSAVIITLNEERNIERCVQAARVVADEIIVVDSFSTDATRQICESLGIRFIQRHWDGYASQKNFGSNEASNDWIISLDADEVLDEELQRSIIQAKNGEKWCYKVNRLTNYCGNWIKHCGWYPEYRARLYDRRKARWDGEYLHERLISDESEPAMALRGNLLHYSYPNLESHVEKLSRYSVLGAQRLKHAGRRFRYADLLFRPPSKFVRMYILERGFLDGFGGFCLCVLSAYGTFLKYAYLKFLTDSKDERAT